MKKTNENNNKSEELMTLDQIEIEPLRDEELEGIVGGRMISEPSGGCSDHHCSN
jgi:hypothetical protein